MGYNTCTSLQYTRLAGTAAIRGGSGSGRLGPVVRRSAKHYLRRVLGSRDVAAALGARDGRGRG